MMTVEQSVERIKKELDALDRENAWNSLDREEVIDMMLLQEIKAANETFEASEVRELGLFVSNLIEAVSELLVN